MAALETREYSQRLGVIAPEQLQAALDRFGLGRLLAAQPCPGGLFGQNLFLSSTEGEFVLRGRPHYYWQLPQERWFARAIHERSTVPAPWPYLVEPDEGLFGWSYAIMPRLPGLQVTSPEVRASLDEDDKNAIAGALGRGLARLQELTSAFYGPYDVDKGEPVADDRPFRQVILESMESWYERCLGASGATTESDIEWCREIVDADAPALDLPFQATVVHHDYKEGNSVFERDGGGWRLSGVFDLMECYFGDPEEDLPRAISGYGPGPAGRRRIRAFMDGYLSGGWPRPGYRERFRIYLLRDLLLLWEYGQRNGIWFEPLQALRSWAQPYLDIDPFF